jgi:hypothetical protein
MTKNNWMLVLLAIVLFAVYAVYFTDWFKPKTLMISSAYRDLHRGPARPGMLRPMMFRLGLPARLTDVLVVPFDAYQTNKNIPPLWHLTTSSNSIPTREFFYGEYIGGMHQAIKGTHPFDLETNVPYLIIVHAGKVEGTHKFEIAGH